jgi:hypothetical protein
MNAPLRTAVYGAVFGLALALNTAAAQDQDQTGPTTALPESSNTPAPKAESKPAASKPTAQTQAAARGDLQPTSIAKLTKFEDFDKNKDGSLAKDEIPLNDQLSVNFASYDANGDSKLSQDEFAKYNGRNQQLARNKTEKAKQQSKPEQQ